MPSLPPVSAKVIADIEQFVSEFRRAENVTRRTTDNIDRELDSLAKKTAKKFQLGDVGKDILKGAGLFGGFQIAETAAQSISDHFRLAAEAAKAIEESSARSLEHTRKMIAMNQTEEQQLATAKKRREEAARTLEDLQRIEAKTRTIFPSGGIGARPMPVTTTDNVQRGTAAQIREATAELEKMDELVKGMEKRAGDKKISEAMKETADRTRVLSEQLRIQEKAFDDLVAKQSKTNDETVRTREEATRLAEKFKEMADPTLRFTKQIEEAEKAAADGKITFAEAARAVEALKRAMAADEKSRVNSALDEFFGQMDEHQKDLNKVKDGARDLGLTFTSAFEDAIIDGEKLGDVLRSLERDLLRIALRKNITEPLFNAAAGSFRAGGMLAGIGSLFGFATGGHFTVGGSGGTDSQVVAFKATPGEKVSVRTPAQAGNGGGDTFVFSPQIASGVTQQDLAAMLPRMYDSFVARVADKVRRGGGYRRAFAS